MRSPFRRGRAWSVSFAALATVLLVSTSMLAYVGQRLFDTDTFVSFIGDSLDEPEVRDFLADTISDQILAAAPDAAAGGTILRDVTAAILGTDAVKNLIEAAARDLHRTIFDDKGDSTVLVLSDMVVAVKGQLQLLSPELAELIPEELHDVAVSLGSRDISTDLAQLASDAAWLTAAMAALAAVFLVLAAVLDSNRWRGIGHGGLALAVSGGLILVLVVAGDAIAASYAAGSGVESLTTALWGVFFAGLVSWAWILVLAGAVVCAVAWSVLRLEHLTTPIGWARSVVTRPPRTRLGQFLRALAALGLAVWLIRSPLSLIAAAASVAGVGLAIAAVRELLRLTGLDRRLSAMDAPAESGTTMSARRALILAGATAAGLAALTVAGVAILAADGPDSGATASEGCNGHVALCSKRLDQVAIAATHNSMSAAADNFYLANHTKGIVSQLDAGYRGLLIDTVYGQRGEGGGPVLTAGDIGDPAGLDDADDEAAAAAQRIRERFVGDTARTEVFLCHRFCEIGWLHAAEALGEVRAWLDAHLREVLVIFIQDATSPEDTVQMLIETGLAELAYAHAWGDPLPTLGEMIDSGKRVFVMAEEDAGSGEFTWYHDGFAYTQETPFSFSSVEDFSCEPNRGRADSPLFQVNHFLTPALGRNGSINDLDVLLPRLRQCQAERGLVPNLVPVDFFEAGDAIGAVDAINGVG